MAGETIQSVERTFRIIEVLAREGSQGITELSGKLELHKTTVYRMLSTLMELGYVAQNGDNGKYSLTYQIVALANNTRSWNTAARAADPYLKELVETCQETVHLVQREGSMVRYIAKVEPNNGSFHMGSYVGMELPMYCTAVGKAMMAELPEAEAQAIWEKNRGIRYTDKTVLTWEELRGQLRKVRETGFAFDDEEREVGLFCVAVCIRDSEGKPCYGMSISAPLARMNYSNVGDYCKRLQAAKEQISRVLGSR